MSDLAKQLIEKEKRERTGKLDLGRCGLTDLEMEVPELFELEWLEELTLSNSYWDWEKRKWIASLLKGPRNRLSKLPSALAWMSNLNILHMDGELNRGWQIIDISVLEGLTCLKSVSLRCNQIHDITPLRKLINLQSLDLSTNRITDISSLKEQIDLQRLDISSNFINDINPLEILTGLQYLDISSNKLSEIGSLEKLKGLQLLSLRSNRISDAGSIEKLESLQSLSLNNNKIHDIHFLKKLKSLTLLDLSKNLISDTLLLENLTSLNLLYLQSNQINDIRFLENLTSLTSLNLSFNQISNIKSLEKLTGLTSLDLSYNQISDITPLLPLIEKGGAVTMEEYGSGIRLYENPLAIPPLEVVKEGNEAVIRYFKELKDQGEEIVYEAKMLILGDAGAGKTSLARKIEDPDAEMPKEVEDSTPGIAVKPLVLNERQPDFTMHIWDFGGQEVYHATHQFFLSKRSLYVLLADGRKEEQLDYWLQMQEIYGQDSRLLLVVNQKGEIQPNLPMADIRRDFPNVQEAQPTIINLKTDRVGAIALRQRIENAIRSLPQFEQGIRTPKIWAAIRRQLEEMKEDHINLKDFRSICEAQGIIERERQDYLLEFLHNLGAVLHFKEVAGLRQLVILKPTWATEAVYRLLDHTKKKGENGHFTKKDLNAVWHCAEYEDYFDELLLLMRQFELCYEAPEEKHLFIVPSLLPDDRPVGTEWEQEPGEMQLWYEYSFMPKGIVTRLIVRQHNLLENPPIVWKRGGVFEINGARAEVTESFRDKRISLRANGKNAKLLLTTLARDIDALNKGFHFNERMALKQIVPCNCSKCKASSRPFKFVHERLEKFLENGRVQIECEESWQMVSIPDLLRETFSDVDEILKRLEKRESSVLESGKYIDEVKAFIKRMFDDTREEETKVEPPLAFFSYSKKDVKHLDKFKSHLTTLKLNGKIRLWDDRDIKPGEEWDETIKNNLAASDIIFLLVSSDFLATNYIQSVELVEAINKHKAKTARVIPIKLREVSWTGTPFSHLQGIPRKDKIVASTTNKDKIWTEVVKEIESVLDDWQG